ncbi:ABC1 kinase family protein [Paraliomyxa miuraensis]|uniref:ABC1 kinase family protein n=1 Tax=Paraliomyxa miuraensis TaxID=376150 RepID=UPI002259CEBD|nr:AarF/ABC1/UbiB kinase family protein [Paraliomyxa miuraensis]MCX4247053.1 AarF/ABC1/UbiB kinase family protein [Paraliomyxa miuraensis]
MADEPSTWAAAWTAGRLAGRRLLGRAVGERDLQLGEQLTSQLDRMKGLAMKVGQIVSYLDVPLPDEVQEQLARLQTGQRGMPGDEVRAVVEAALGMELEAAFEAFDWEPVAAASIGQVHRARVDGRAVAVKVQYPGVARSFTDDLRAVGRISSLASMASAVDGRAMVEELRRRLTEECDYVREARAQLAFARAFGDDPEVCVPQVLTHRSAGTVLTSAWVEGEGFSALEAEVDPVRRNAIAATLVRFSYRSLLQLGVIQADPHPGNFVFPRPDASRPAGSVAFLDFGCVRALPLPMVDALREVVAAVRDDDRPRFRRAVVALGVVGRPKKFDYEHFFAVMEHLHRPLCSPRFSFDKAYVREGFALNGPRSPNARTIAMPPAYLWVARLQWGLWSILARLRAEGSFRPVLDELLDGPVVPPSLDEGFGRGASSPVGGGA